VNRQILIRGNAGGQGKLGESINLTCQMRNVGAPGVATKKRKGDSRNEESKERTSKFIFKLIRVKERGGRGDFRL